MKQGKIIIYASRPSGRIDSQAGGVGCPGLLYRSKE
jgi:hypothetical protein